MLFDVFVMCVFEDDALKCGEITARVEKREGTARRIVELAVKVFKPQ